MKSFVRFARFARGATVRTFAHQFQYMQIDFKSGLAFQTRNQRREVTILKLLRFAARGTDEMMRVSARAGRIAVTAAGEMHALHVAEFGQQVERAINSDESEMRIFFARAFMDFGGREVMVGGCDNVQNRAARTRQLAAMFAQTVAHFGRNRCRHFF